MPSDKNDLAQRVALCQPGDTVRGFIFKAVYGRVELRVGSAGLDRMLGRLRLHKRPMDSFSYPLVDFLRLLYEGADLLEPHEGSVEAAWRSCGVAAVTGFLKSYVGHSLMRFISGGDDPRRALSTVQSVYSTVVSFGARDYQDLGQQRALITFRQDVQPVAFHEGAMDEVLRVLAGRGHAKGKVLSLAHAEYVLDWSGAPPP